MLRQIWRAAWITVAALFLLAALILAGVHTPPARKFVLAQVKQLAESSGLSLSASSLDYNLLSGWVDLRNVRLAREGTFQERPFLSADRIRVDARMLELIRGSVSLEDVLADSLAVDLFTDSQGQSNLPSTPGASNSPPANELPAVVISHLAADGGLTIEDERNGLALRIPAWRLALQGESIPYQENLRFNMEQAATLQLEERQVSINSLAIDATVSRTRARLESIQLATTGGEIRVQGDLNGFADPELDLNITAGLDLARWLEFAAISPPPVSGMLQASIQTRNKLSELEATADLTTADLAAPPLRNLRTQARVHWARSNPTAVDVESATIRAPEGTITASASWRGTTPDAQNQISARIESLNLALLLQTLGARSQVASLVNGSLNARWPGISFESANGDMRLAMTPLTTDIVPAVVPVSGVISAHAQNRTVTVSAQSVEAVGVAVDADIAVTLDPSQRFDGGISGTIRGRAPQLQAVLMDVRAFSGQSTGALVGGESIAGTADLEVNLGGSLQQPTATASLNGSGIEYGPLKNVNLNADATYNPAHLTVPRLNVRWEDTEISADASLGLTEADRSLSFHLASNEVSLSEMLSAFGLQLPVSGQAEVKAQGAGTLDDPDISLGLRGRDLLAYGEKLGELDVQAKFRGKKIDVQSLQMNRPEGKGTLSADASYQTETGDYAFHLQGTGLDIGDLQMPSLAPVKAAIDINGEGAGNIANPAANITMNVRDAAWNGEEIGSLDVRAQIADRAATATVEAPRFGLTGDVRAQTEAPYSTTVAVTLSDTDLSLVSPVRGRVSLKVQADGLAGQWRDGHAALTVSRLSVETEAGEFQNSGDIQIGYANRALNVIAAKIAGPMAEVSLQGELPIEENGTPGTLRYHSQADLAALAPLAGKTVLGLQGQAQIDGELRGSLAKLEPSASIRVHDANISSPNLQTPLSGIQLTAALKDGLLSIEQFQALLGDGSINGNGLVPLGLFPIPSPIDIPQATTPARFTMNASNIALSSLTTLPETVRGQVGFTLEAEASRPEPNALQATLTFNQLNLNLAGTAFTASVPPRITLRGEAVRVEQFALTGANSEIRLTGGTSLSDREFQDVHLSGHLDAALLGGLVDDLAARGFLDFDVAAVGQWNQPQLAGTIGMANGQVSIPSPRVDLSDLNFRAALSNDKIDIERFQADLNGGTFGITGAIGLRPKLAPDLRLTASDVYLDVPAGLRTLSNLDLHLSPRDEELILGGEITVQDGSYTDVLDLPALLQRYLESRGSVQLAEERNAFLDRLRFDIAVKSGDPVVLDNNLGKLAFLADLRLTGNYYRPGLTGRVSIEDGGTLRLQENDYVIEQGGIDFVNETRIEPQVNIQASTKVRDRTITVDVTTDSAGKINTEFSSDDAEDTRADIISLLLTGRTADELQGTEQRAAGNEAAASLVAGSVSGRLSQQLQGGLGLSRVRLEPDLISNETDPTARLTIGQDLTQFLELIYSMNLRDSTDQIWILRYQLARRFNTQAIKQADDSYRFDFRHDLRFGGIPVASRAPRKKEERRVGSVTFAGDLKFPEEQLSKKFGLKPGDRYDFFKLRKGLDRLQSLYRDEGYLEARIRNHREQDGSINLILNIEAGQHVDFVFEGWTPGGGLRNRVRNEWERGAFDSQRAEMALSQIRRQLGNDGYLKPQLEYEIRPNDDRKQVTFIVIRGKRYEGAELVFDGAMGIEPAALERQLKRAGLREKIESQPAQVRNFLTQYYRQEGYLDADVSGPDYQYDEQALTAQVRFTISEGPKYRWGRVNVTGATVYSTSELDEISGIRGGTPYTPQAAQDSRDRVEEAYWKKGYRDVVVDYNLSRRSEAGLVDLTANIQEGPQSIVDQIQVTGTDQTSPNFVTKQIDLAPGNPLDYTKTTEARRNLYNTGAFSSVDLRAEPIGAPPDITAQLKHVRLLADVHERTPYQIRYGGFYDTDRGPGAIVDFWNRNTLGGGRVIGGRLRYDGDVREARAFFSQPLLRSFPLRTDTSTFIRREFKSTFITDRVGASIQQVLRMRNRFILTYGYRFERAHTYDTEPDPFFPFDETLRVAPLTFTLTRDSRDDTLDATRGSFTSQSMEYATSQLGSSLLYLRYFGQYFHYLPLTDPAPVPFGGGRERSRVVYAGGVRVGLAKGLGGQQIIPSEHFFAGGGTTIRGFERNTLGPQFAGEPDGGDAMLIINNELRFPAFSIFDGVGFVDIGNVYPKIGDFSFTDVRETVGAGLRVRTPYFLLRFDYGLKLDRREGESRGAFFFSIGQAF